MVYHHTKTKGDTGALKIAADLSTRGFTILWPMTEHAPFDLVAYKDGKFSRVQIKFKKASSSKETIYLDLRRKWSDGNGLHTKSTDLEQIDLVGVYCPDTDTCYYVHSSKFGGQYLSLRLDDRPTHGNGRQVHRAKDFLAP